MAALHQVSIHRRRHRNYVRSYARTYVRTYVLTYVRTYVRTYVLACLVSVFTSYGFIGIRCGDYDTAIDRCLYGICMIENDTTILSQLYHNTYHNTYYNNNNHHYYCFCDIIYGFFTTLTMRWACPLPVGL